MLGLPLSRLIPRQADRREIVELAVGDIGVGAVVEVLDAHQEATVRRAGEEPRQHGRTQVADVQISRWAGSKPAGGHARNLTNRAPKGRGATGNQRTRPGRTSPRLKVSGCSSCAYVHERGSRSGRSGTNERSLPAFQREPSFRRGVRPPVMWAAQFHGWASKLVTRGCNSVNSRRRSAIG